MYLNADDSQRVALNYNTLDWIKSPQLSVERRLPERIFAQIQRSHIARIRIDAVSLDATLIKVHPDSTGGLKKRHPSHRKSRGGRNAKIHLVTAHERTALNFSLSLGQAHDAPCGRALLKQLEPTEWAVHLLMDRAYEGNETHALAAALGFTPGRATMPKAP